MQDLLDAKEEVEELFTNVTSTVSNVDYNVLVLSKPEHVSWVHLGLSSMGFKRDNLFDMAARANFTESALLVRLTDVLGPMITAVGLHRKMA